MVVQQCLTESWCSRLFHSVAFNNAPHSAPITQVTSRILLTVVVIAVIALALWGMRRAWIAKANAFRDVPAPIEEVPAGATAVTAMFPARMAGTTLSGQWLRRVTVHGLGTPRSVVAGVYVEGIRITDEGSFNVWIPREHIDAIRTGRGLAGDVVEPDGMVIITWRLGEHLIDTGLRIQRNDDHQHFYLAATDLLKVSERNGEKQ